MAERFAKSATGPFYDPFQIKTSDLLPHIDRIFFPSEYGAPPTP